MTDSSKTNYIKNKSTEITKNDLETILDRTIGFVRNCDSKASVFLGTVGLGFSVVLTVGGCESIHNIMKSMLDKLTVCGVLHFVFIIISILAITLGLVFVGLVLCVQINFKSEIGLDCDSKIFFENIKRNGSFLNYRRKLLKMTEDELMNDIMSQIYINSCIASNKYRLYGIGIKFCMIGLMSFVVLWAMGIIIY